MAIFLKVSIDELFEPQVANVAVNEQNWRRPVVVATGCLGILTVLFLIALNGWTYDVTVDVTADFVNVLNDQMQQAKPFEQSETLIRDRTNDRFKVGNDTKGEGRLRVNGVYPAGGRIGRIERHRVNIRGDRIESVEWSGDLRVSVDFVADSSAAWYYYAGWQLARMPRWQESQVPGRGKSQILVFGKDDSADAKILATLDSVSRSQVLADASLADKFIETRLLLKIVAPARGALRDLGVGSG